MTQFDGFLAFNLTFIQGVPNLLCVLLNVSFQFTGQPVLFLVDFCLRTIATLERNSEAFNGKFVNCFLVVHYRKQPCDRNYQPLWTLTSPNLLTYLNHLEVPHRKII